MVRVNKVSFQHAWPRATFFAAYGDTATGQWHPAQAVLDQGMVTLWILTPTGWAQAFSLPAAQARVSSATHRITLVAGGRTYPLLADQASVARANALTTAGLAASMLEVSCRNALIGRKRLAHGLRGDHGHRLRVWPLDCARHTRDHGRGDDGLACCESGAACRRRTAGFNRLVA